MFRRIALVTTLAVAIPVYAIAGSVAGTGGATEVTQLLNNVQLGQQTQSLAQQVTTTLQQLQVLQQQLQYAQQNLITAPQQIWGIAQSDLARLISLAGQANTITYAAGVNQQQFNQLYPGYQGAQTTQTNQYSGLLTSSFAAQQSAIQNAGLNISQFATERAAIQTIQSTSANSPGALQAVQAGNMLTSQIIDQMQKVRVLIADQTTAQANAAAAQGQNDSNGRAAAQAFNPAYVAPVTTNDSDPGW